MLLLELREQVWLRGEEHLQAFLQRRGMTAREAQTLSRPQKMNQVRDTLVQRLCEGLVCMPNDLFRWYGDMGHALAALNVPLPMNVPFALKNVPYARLEEVLHQLAQEEEQSSKPSIVHGGRLFINVRRLMELEQVSRVHKELQWKGFTHNEAQKLLSDDRKSIKLSMLARVCVAFKCLPNDVYDFEGPEGHVLSPLRKAPVVNVRERLGKLSEAELRRVLGLIKN